MSREEDRHREVALSEAVSIARVAKGRGERISPDEIVKGAEKFYAFLRGRSVADVKTSAADVVGTSTRVPTDLKVAYAGYFPATDGPPPEFKEWIVYLRGDHPRSLPNGYVRENRQNCDFDVIPTAAQATIFSSRSQAERAIERVRRDRNRLGVKSTQAIIFTRTVRSVPGEWEEDA